MPDNKTVMTTNKKQSVKTASKSAHKKSAESQARAKLEMLAALEKENQRNQRGRRITLIVSLMLNLAFIITIYVILQQNM